jgi:hypothetical protein
MTRRLRAHTANDLRDAYELVWFGPPELYENDEAHDDEPENARAADPAYQRWLRDNNLRDLSPAEVAAHNRRVYAQEAAAARRAAERAPFAAFDDRSPPSLERGPRRL